MTVNEFFENLEIILRGEFEINNVAKSVSFRFTEDILAGIAPVDVDMVVDEFSADIDTMNDDKSDLDLLKIFLSRIMVPGSGRFIPATGL